MRSHRAEGGLFSIVGQLRVRSALFSDQESKKRSFQSVKSKIGFSVCGQSSRAKRLTVVVEY